MARHSALACGLAIAVALTACRSGDPRLERLSTGISKDSVIVLFDAAAPAHSDPYLTGGHYIEAMYYPRPGADSTVADREMSPVVLVDGQVIGWGWKVWDSVATANGIVLKK